MNIKYIVRQKVTIEEVFSPVIEDVSLKSQNADRTIIFCLNVRDCFDIYQCFRMKLKQRTYYAPTAPQLSKYQLVDTFTSVTEESVKCLLICRTWGRGRGRRRARPLKLSRYEAKLAKIVQH